jgi:Transcriptional regulator
MPKQVRFTKEIIIKAAIEILRSDGIEALTARSLSKKLGCSVAPLFHKYANMEELTADVRKAAGKIVSDYLADAVNYEPAFKEFGLDSSAFQRRSRISFTIYSSTRTGVPIMLMT